jgi:hypothetical protein
MEMMIREVAEHVRGLLIPGSGHWVAEENPQALLIAMKEFLDQTTCTSI